MQKTFSKKNYKRFYVLISMIIFCIVLFFGWCVRSKSTTFHGYLSRNSLQENAILELQYKNYCRLFRKRLNFSR